MASRYIKWIAEYGILLIAELMYVFVFSALVCILQTFTRF